MADDLTESTVRQHLRDQSGELHCARCLARVLNRDPSATEAAVVALSEWRPRLRRVSVAAATPGSSTYCSSRAMVPPHWPDEQGEAEDAAVP
jgi:hypothetical protein